MKTKKTSHDDLLFHLNITNPKLLGEGMEGYVYDYRPGKVIKIWVNKYSDTKHLQERKEFYQKIYSDDFDFDLPLIYQVDSYNGTFYTIEKKLLGERGDIFYLKSNKKTQLMLLDNYFAILDTIKKINIDGNYGELLSGPSGRTTSDDWVDFLKIKLEQTKEKCLHKPDHDLENIEALFDKFYRDDLLKLNHQPNKQLVHGDLFLENILVTKKGNISALLDFGPLTVIGDHLMDVAAIVYFVTVSQGIGENVKNYLEKLAKEKHPGELNIIKIYLIYYSLLFINSKNYDPRTYKWCKKNLIQANYLK